MGKRKIETRLVSTEERKLSELFRRLTDARLGPNSTFEERRDMAAVVRAEVLAKLMDKDATEDHGVGLFPDGGEPCPTITRANE